MIQTADRIPDILGGYAGDFGESFFAAGRVGAQTDIFDFGIIIHCPAVDCHRVAIAHQPGIGTNFFHVMADIQQGRDLNQSLENTAGSGSIGLDFQSPFPGNFPDKPGCPPTAGTNTGDNIIGTIYRSAAVGG